MFETEEDIIQHMHDIASAHGLEYEVLQTYNKYVAHYEKSFTLTMDERVGLMFDALYEWDI